MTKSLIIASIMISALLTSCGEGSKGTTASQEQTTATDSLPLIGRTLHIDYGQMQAIVTYGQDTLIWQTSSPDGKTSEQTKEEPNYEVLGDGRTFATWQEASGEVVAQIVDLKAQQVTAFIYAPLIEGQTSRSATRLTGKITQQ